MIINIIKKSFAEVNSNPAITLCSVSFLILTSIFMQYTFVLQNRLYALIIIFLIFLLTALFLGGWFQMFDEVQKEEKRPLAGIFFEGAGKNIVPAILMLIIYFAAFLLVTALAILISSKLFGDLTFLMNDMASIPQDSGAYMEYLKNLPSDKMFIMYGWQLTFLVMYSAFNFLFLFIPAAFIKAESKNCFLRPFVVLKENFMFVFKNFWFSILVYLTICIGFIIMNIFRMFASMNSILSIVYILINIYFISYVVMIIFNCYEEKNSGSNRPDSIREDENIDSVSEEV